VEVIKDPALAGKPVIVGGTSSRGVVTSASYEARRTGVTSAMPTSRARRLCPHGIYLPLDFDAYGRYSKQVREVFDSFSPVVEPLALDEAFLDLRGATRMWPGPEALGEALRREVKRATGLVVSVGLAPNKFLAKLASRHAKPDGLLMIPPDAVVGFLHPLPVGDLWGVGERTAELLERLGLRTIGDVAAVPAATLQRPLGGYQRADRQRQGAIRQLRHPDQGQDAAPGGGLHRTDLRHRKDVVHQGHRQPQHQPQGPSPGGLGLAARGVAGFRADQPGG